MIQLNQDTFNDLIDRSTVKTRLRRELKFVASTDDLPQQWSEYELLHVTSKNPAKGVLLLQPGDELYVAEYELSPLSASSATGRTSAIICDFCMTWQSGTNAASIGFIDGASKRSVRYLCCGDLQCSRNVRTTTRVAVLSRSQLRESLSNEDRIERLKSRLTERIHDLHLTPVVLETSN